jgi:hypothetical protein
MSATGEWGGEGKENKCNHIEIKGRWGRLTDEIKWKWQKEIKQFAVVFANEHRANCAICRAPARFPVLKGPIHRQRVRAKQTSHFSLFNWPTFKYNHKDSQKHPWVKNAIWTTFFTKAKGTLCHRKRALFRFSENLGAPFPPPPRFLRPWL